MPKRNHHKFCWKQRVCRGACLALALLLGSAFSAQAQLLWSVSPRDDVLRQVDPYTAETVSNAITITSGAPSPPTIRGVNAMTAHPSTGDLYALLRVAGTANRRLVTLNTATGVATDVGNNAGDTGKNLSALAFDAAGTTLYALTGDGSSPAEHLCTIDLTTAAATCSDPLGNGSDGEVLSWADDGFLYHYSGLGELDEPLDGAVFETIDPSDPSIQTLIPQSGVPHGAITSLSWNGTDFFAAGRGDDIVDDPFLYRVRKDGVWFPVGQLDHVSRGLVLDGPYTPDCVILRWRFDEVAGAAPQGTTAFEENCGFDGTVGGAGAILTGTSIALPGGVGTSGAAYVDLPNGLLSSRSLSDASFEIWYTVDGPHAWARAFDFGASAGTEVLLGDPGVGAGTNFIFYSTSIFSDVDQQRAETTAGGFGQSDMAEDTTLGQTIHVVVTYEADGAGPGSNLMTTYRDGVQVAQTTATGSLSAVDDVNNWLGRSNFSGDGFLEGEIEEFRLYDYVMTPADVALTHSQGPDIPVVYVPEPASAESLLASLLLLTALAMWRARRRGRPGSARA